MTEALSPEHTGSVEELIALHNTLQRCFADPADPVGSLEAQRSELADIIAAAHQQPYDEQAHALIDYYATIVEFLWFGGQADSLPAALGYYPSDYQGLPDWGNILLRPEVFRGGHFNAITQTLMPLGLGVLLQQRSEYAEQQKEQVREAFKALVATTPAAQWYNAFKVGQAKDEVPLTPLLRAGPEREIREGAESEFGPSYNARSQAGRRMAGLDDRTTWQSQRQAEAEDARAFKLVREHVDDYVGENARSEQPANMEFADGFLYTYDANGRLIDEIDVGSVALDLLRDDQVPLERTYALNDLSQDFYLCIAENIYSSANGHRMLYDQLFETGGMKRFLDHLLEGFTLTSGRRVSEALSLLKYVNPSQPFDNFDIIDRQSGGDLSLSYPFSEVAELRHNTQDMIERDRRKLAGMVEKYANPTPDTTRLLQANFRNHDLPVHPSETAKIDLVLALEDFEDDPHVHGYRLIAADRLQNRFWFTYDRTNDPYLPNKTRFSAEGRLGLAQSYADFCLYTLARNVRRRTALTISKLSELSQANGVYTFREPGHPDFGLGLTSLEACSYFVTDDALRATCDIYGGFGKFSLNVVLPEGQEAFVIGGLPLPAEGGLISRVGHAQVAIKHLATEAVVSVTEWSPSVAGGQSSYIGARRHTRRLTVPPPERARPGVVVPITVARQVTLSTERLMMQLGAMFAPRISGEIPAEYIYQRAMRLGVRHPIVKTLGALLRAGEVLQTSDELSAEMADELTDVLAEVEKAYLKDKSGRSHAQLQILRATLQPIVRLLNR